MKCIQSLSRMQLSALRWRESGKKIALVPTMGYLHEGHLSLMRMARKLVGKSGVVVTSIYVNPTQFGPSEDFSKYPRDLKSDKKLCAQTGVDVLFLPDDKSMYPTDGSGLKYSVFVNEKELSQGMEGASRPGHFEGVTTVVTKLFLLTQPHFAVFGAKDFQQARVIQKMTTDLNFPVQIQLAPTAREPDGLAMSSRNKYLTPEQRLQASALWSAIQSATEILAAAKGKSVQAGTLRGRMLKQIESNSAFEVDYIEFFNPQNLQPVTRVDFQCRVAIAARLGRVRLIDNASLAGSEI